MKKNLSAFFSMLLICIITFKVAAFEEKVLTNSFTTENLTIDLPDDGEWKHIMHHRIDREGAIIKSDYLIKFNNGIFSELIETLYVDGSPDYPQQTLDFFQDYLLKAEEDRGCRKHIEYYIFELKRKGRMANCFIVRIMDPNNEIYSPKKKITVHVNFNHSPRILQRYFSNNNIKLPKSMLRSSHYYYDKRGRGRMYMLLRMSNIQDKEHLKDWSELQAKRHQQFEKNLKIRSTNELDLISYIDTNNLTIPNEIILELKTLNKLYIDGVLTKEQFETAKEKILN